MKSLTELMADYRHSIERSLAGIVSGKSDDNLSDDNVDAAKELSQQTSDEDYLAIGMAMQTDDTEEAEEEVRKILKKYDPEPYFGRMEESKYVDRDLLESSGFSFFANVPSYLCDKVCKYLDKCGVEYQQDGMGQFQLKIGNRDTEYKVENGIEKIMRSSKLVLDNKYQ